MWCDEKKGVPGIIKPAGTGRDAKKNGPYPLARIRAADLFRSMP